MKRLSQSAFQQVKRSKISEEEDESSSQPAIKMIFNDANEAAGFEDQDLIKLKFSNNGDISTHANSLSSINRGSFNEFPPADVANEAKTTKSSSKIESYQKFCLTYATDEDPKFSNLQFVNHDFIKQPMTHNLGNHIIHETELSKSSKGRKRKMFSQWNNIQELIESEVIAQWAIYLKKKMLSNEDKETGITPRDDTIWKKVFRDLREFYRILFKARFHPLDYKTWEQADSCWKILLEELGINTKHLTSYDLRKKHFISSIKQG